MIFLEIFILQLQDKKQRLPRSNDAFSSISAGIVSLMPLYVFVFLKSCIIKVRNYLTHVIVLRQFSPVLLLICSALFPLYLLAK